MKVAPSSVAAQTAPALAAGLQNMGLCVDGATQQRLLTYLDLLARWNRVYNLTALTDPLLMVTHHLLDSMALLPYLQGPRILDVGSGAGLPGIPLALLAPHWSFTLLDSQAKKTRFIQQAVIDLQLDNIEIVTSRIEYYQPKTGFDTIMARAVGSLKALLAQTERVSGPGTHFIFPKGHYPQPELAELTVLPNAHYQIHIYPLQIPQLQNRHLVSITKVPLPA